MFNSRFLKKELRHFCGHKIQIRTKKISFKMVNTLWKLHFGLVGWRDLKTHKEIFQ